jgi:hypothetical protein
MRRVIPVLGLVLLFASSAAAQRLEVAGDYVYSHRTSSDHTSSTGNGESADIALFPLGHLGVVANLGGGSSSSFTRTQNGVATSYSGTEHNFHYLFGPRTRFGISRLSIYLQVLGGGVSRSAIVDSNTADAGKPGPNGSLVIPFTFAPAATSWAVEPAIGVDIGITRFWAVRIGQFGETITGFKPVSSTGSAIQATFTYSAGIVFRL